MPVGEILSIRGLARMVMKIFTPQMRPAWNTE